MRVRGQPDVWEGSADMADTVYLKRGVEQYVRGTLCEEYGVKFSSKILTLVTGGTLSLIHI